MRRGVDTGKVTTAGGVDTYNVLTLLMGGVDTCGVSLRKEVDTCNVITLLTG